jgi:hypothetical protein
MAITKEMREKLDHIFEKILNSARHYPGGNLARFSAEQQVRGMMYTARSYNPGCDDDFSLTKLEDIYISRIQKEMNY